MKRFFSLLALFCLIGQRAYSVPPAPKQNYCPIVVVNSTTLNANQIYFVAHGNDPSGLPCFLVPDVNGYCQYVYPTPSGTPSSADSSVLLSALPTATGTGQTDPAFLFYIPINSAARAYFSINNPMYLATAFNPQTGVLAINDSSVTAITDPNYYTYYQDIEFGLVPGTLSATLLYLNLSWVDYFCLPMQLETYSYPSNTPIVNAVSTPSGFTPTTTRESIITATNTGLTTKQVTPNTWGVLGLAYYNNPYTDSTPTTYTRILAAKNSLSLGQSANFKGAKVPQKYFPPTFAQNTSTGPVASQSYMQTVYNYYNTTNTGNPLTFEIFPANNPTAIYQMASDPTQSSTLTLKFTCLSGGGPSPIFLALNSLTTEQLLSGSVWPFTPTNTSTAYTNEISKLISALFTIGYFPYPTATSMGSPFVNNTSGYVGTTYFLNPNNYAQGPWYNVYDAVLHPQFVSHGAVGTANPNLGLAYGYDYDDLLNMSGIINGMEIQDQYGNPSSATGSVQPYVVMTLGSLSGTPIPNIANDSYTYTVTVGSAAGGVGVSFTYYNGTTTVTTPASTTTTTLLGPVTADSTHPFQINFTFNSIVYTYNINLLRQVVTPISATSSFSSTDQYFLESVEFILSGSQTNPSFLIQYNSAPPPWPG
ncbi:MAG: hypothetical protein JSS32_08915 [Verrucomicrobia bacterium]|nr:hypothetical protein [Verrucomicrobiota bacterium]